MDLLAELHLLVSRLDEAGVPYAICGGFALAIHGFPRATNDIDLLVPTEHFESGRTVLRACEFSLEALPMRFPASGIELRRFSKASRAGLVTVDVLLADAVLASVWAARQRIDWEHGSLWVVSREGLVAMKLTAGRPQDMADVARLEGAGEG